MSSTMGSTAVDRFRDEYEIKSLLTRERYYRDTGQWQKLRDAYHPDPKKTLINISWYTGEIDGFVSGSETMAKNGTRAQHSVTPGEIHFQGDKALADTPGSIRCMYNVGEQRYYCVSILRFISRLEKTADGWKMLTLEVIYDFDAVTPQTATDGGTPVAAVPTHLRKSYAGISWLLGLRGYTMNQELTGTDRPESVDKLMAAAFAWLQEP